MVYYPSRNNARPNYRRAVQTRQTTYKRRPMAKPRMMRRRPQYVEPIQNEVLSSYVADAGAANNLQLKVECRPDVDIKGVATPNWNIVSSRYDEYRIKMVVLDLILEDTSRPIFSLIDRSNDAKSDTNTFMKDRAHKMHTLTTDNKKVSLMWKPNVSADYDWKSTSTPAAHIPAFMHILMQNTAEVAPKFECRLKVYVECKGQKN